MYPEVALKNIIDMMGKDSACLITVPNGRLDQYEGHINFWSPESWEVFIKSNSGGLHFKIGTINNNKNNFALISNEGIK